MVMLSPERCMGAGKGWRRHSRQTEQLRTKTKRHNTAQEVAGITNAQSHEATRREGVTCQATGPRHLCRSWEITDGRGK